MPQAPVEAVAQTTPRYYCLSLWPLPGRHGVPWPQRPSIYALLPPRCPATGRMRSLFQLQRRLTRPRAGLSHCRRGCCAVSGLEQEFQVCARSQEQAAEIAGEPRVQGMGEGTNACGLIGRSVACVFFDLCVYLCALPRQNLSEQDQQGTLSGARKRGWSPCGIQCDDRHRLCVAWKALMVGSVAFGAALWLIMCVVFALFYRCWQGHILYGLGESTRLSAHASLHPWRQSLAVPQTLNGGCVCRSYVV